MSKISSYEARGIAENRVASETLRTLADIADRLLCKVDQLTAKTDSKTLREDAELADKMLDSLYTLNELAKYDGFTELLSKNATRTDQLALDLTKGETDDGKTAER